MSKKLTKQEKKAIMDKHGSITGDKLYTQEQWSRLMWAGHAEVQRIMREVNEENANEGKGLLGQLRRQDGTIK